MTDISVIIPVKNRADLLRKTLDNLLAQSKKPEEIIVVDDHSTDSIQLVIFDYITDCIFLNNKGSGPGAARNLGMTVATGKYIQFFDSDDLMTKNKLESQFHALEKAEADMAYGPYVQAIETEEGWRQKDVVMQAYPFPESLNLQNWMLRGWNTITQACMFRKSFLQQAAPWNEKLITHEDYLYLFKLSQLNPKLVHVPEQAVIYRQHEKQSTDHLTNQGSRAMDKMEVLMEMKSDLKNIKADLLSQGLFRGRFAQNFQFLKKQGIDPRRYSGFLDLQDALWESIYRLYNHRMRKQTGTLWEPMHGVDSSEQIFKNIIESL